MLLLAAAHAAPTSIDAPRVVPVDLAPSLRACADRSPAACVEAALAADEYGNWALADRLSEAACDAGAADQCTPVRGCQNGDARACRAIDAAGLDLSQRPSPAGLFRACAAGDGEACEYLTELGLTGVQVETFVPHEHGEYVVSPDGRVVLEGTPTGARYVRDGRSVGSIELPPEVRADLSEARWTYEHLRIPLRWAGDSLALIGFWVDGRFEPLPRRWRREPFDAETTCAAHVHGALLTWRCFREGGAWDEAPSRLLRLTDDGRALRSVDLPKGAQVDGGVGQTLFVRTRDAAQLVQRLDARDRSLRPLAPGHALSDGYGLTVFQDHGARLLVHGVGGFGWFTTSDARLERLDLPVGPILAHGPAAWLAYREETIAGQRLLWARFESTSGAGPWFRTDLLMGRSLVARSHGLGFLLSGPGRAAVVWPADHVRPPLGPLATGTLELPYDPKALSWPPPRPSDRAYPDERPARPLEPAPFRLTTDGWPDPAADLRPTTAAIRPISRRMTHVPGLLEAVRACADGATAACAAVLAHLPSNAPADFRAAVKRGANATSPEPTGPGRQVRLTLVDRADWPHASASVRPAGVVTAVVPPRTDLAGRVTVWAPIGRSEWLVPGEDHPVALDVPAGGAAVAHARHSRALSRGPKAIHPRISTEARIRRLVGRRRRARHDDRSASHLALGVPRAPRRLVRSKAAKVLPVDLSIAAGCPRGRCGHRVLAPAHRAGAKPPHGDTPCTALSCSSQPSRARWPPVTSSRPTLTTWRSPTSPSWSARAART